MKETTALNRITKIIENLDYKKVYIEIETKNDRYTLEKEKVKKIAGFRKERE